MDTIKVGLNLIIRYLGSILMSFVIFLSFTAIFAMPLTEEIGYDAYITDEATGQTQKVYTHYYSDGEDTKKAEYESQGFKVQTAQLRSQLTGAGTALIFTAAQLVSIAIFIALVPNRLYRLGASDAEAGESRSIKRWLIPSLFPAAISFVGFILLVLNKLQLIGNQGLSLYRFANYHLYGLLRLILGTGNNGLQISPLAVCLSLLPAVLTILACGTLYEFGYRGFRPLVSLKNKIKYKRDPS